MKVLIFENSEEKVAKELPFSAKQKNYLGRKVAGSNLDASKDL